jgi:hypothetical protein
MILAAVGLLTAPLLTATEAQAAPQISQSAQYQSWKMGGRPASSTICLANGVENYSMAYVMSFLTDYNSGLSLSVRNRCDGYSITNRMTIDTYTAAGTTCVQFANTHRTYDAVQGKEIWDQNIVIKVNNSDYCMPNDTAIAHRFALYVEYILGLSYEYGSTCNATINGNVPCINALKYATGRDRALLNNVYGLAA